MLAAWTNGDTTQLAGRLVLAGLALVLIVSLIERWLLAEIEPRDE